MTFSTEPSSGTIMYGERRKLGPRTYRAYFDALFHIQNGKCIIKGPHCTQAMKEIDHKDNNPSNWTFTNLQGSCKSCNIWKRNKEFPPQHSADSLRLEKERIREVPRTVREPPAEVELNQVYEPAFRAWVLDRALRPEPLYKHEAIYGGALAVGCSPQATREYLSKLLYGPLRAERVRGPRGMVWQIMFAEGTGEGRR